MVEDETAVRQFSVDALSELGYRVFEADGAAAALRILDAHLEIALLFTDIVMPDVNGLKLADEALRRRPDLKLLFTTGYTRNAFVHNGVLDPGVELIGKPFTIEELAAKVREVLDAGSGDTYYQGLPGQSFNVNDLAPGIYYIAVEANPQGRMYEADTENNNAYRKIRIGGDPGGVRTVKVFPAGMIDVN